ncbi:hypothetical protein E5E91_13805 [Deinococcus radiodurans R1 = ATCC 13939 = DSM 20539]|uniref:Uncharacterized protein n=1 Tax=Deinococcus radiodurans (strain ATCC 13939 / DSM 20539 / JCM 16871 / CCUG 27074 / LMG 4051 / NBRC 15346 / NCIMB 9279 / VKM B-1422 / R1) TaxID=243230 RepID=Q9RZC8_DEIRA|nr:hypothetical protein DR_A0026 [Deinococcus radiodurans R1 = ATCC 13939 = DSM 20539]QEM73219.1 hypothetical protein DXG80_15445 [Deinococcus radiodurans]UDL02112.1 hypothetical protein E5E91_13805 [Deinococcus radiodurans R1 = ATCC 13939 = DSM 20539]HCE63635.1 hypothetical protein [Deinococcus radiodurans]
MARLPSERTRRAESRARPKDRAGRSGKAAAQEMEGSGEAYAVAHGLLAACGRWPQQMKNTCTGRGPAGRRSQRAVGEGTAAGPRPSWLAVGLAAAQHRFVPGFQCGKAGVVARKRPAQPPVHPHGGA